MRFFCGNRQNGIQSNFEETETGPVTQPNLQFTQKVQNESQLQRPCIDEKAIKLLWICRVFKTKHGNGIQASYKQ